MWLSNLAGKAEDLLVRLDQNASIVLLQNESNNENNESLSQNDSNPIYKPKNSPRKIINIEGQEHDIHTNESFFNYESFSVLEEEKYAENEETYSEVNNSSSVIHDLETKYVKSQNEIMDLKRLVVELEGQTSILQNRLKQAMSSLYLAQEEVERQRKKAQKLLEDKERLVVQIENMPVSPTANEHVEYISKIMKSRDDQNRTVHELSEKLDLVQSDLAATQKQCSLLQNEAFGARKALEKKEKARLVVEDELAHSKKELNKVYEELKINISSLNNRQEEILQLQQQIEVRPNVDNEELESKFHVLTRTLIMKQNSLETVTTERNALRLQLERVENDYSKLLVEYNTKQTASVINIDNYDEGRNPSFFTMSPFDEGVTKRVKRAISTINAFSIRLGVFLRRYPVARVFLLCYMILLQIDRKSVV